MSIDRMPSLPRLNFSLNCRGRLLSLERPIVMAIINLSPDSFYNGNQVSQSEQALIDRVGQCLEHGAAVIDLGGASSRPGAADVPVQLELERVATATQVLAKAYPSAILSVDTFRAVVAKAALDAGASIINDISGGTADADMWPIVGAARVPFIAMHRAGPSATMQLDPSYPDGVTETVYSFFSQVLAKAREYRVDDVVLDPGFGFGKTDAHNYELLARLRDFRFLRRPLLVGLSRKSMLTRVTGRSAADALQASTAAHTLALQGGADILRVHDVAAARDAIAVFEAFQAWNPYGLPPVPLI